nr:MAG TPA: hypothetical protein [Bacteriophage sp.]
MAQVSYSFPDLHKGTRLVSQATSIRLTKSYKLVKLFKWV